MVREEKQITLVGEVSFRPQITPGLGSLQKDTAIITTKQGSEFRLKFISEDPYKQEITKKYEKKSIVCTGSFFRDIFFAKMYETPRRAPRRLSGRLTTTRRV